MFDSLAQANADRHGHGTGMARATVDSYPSEYSEVIDTGTGGTGKSQVNTHAHPRPRTHAGEKVERNGEMPVPPVPPVPTVALVAPLMVHALPCKPGEPPPEIRLRQWLKLGLRAFGIRAEWAPSPGGPTLNPIADPQPVVEPATDTQYPEVF